MGFAIVAGGARATEPVRGILAADLAVGSTVKLMEGDTAVEYLVVNQGKPSGSSLYDDSCDGTWLLRKDCHSQRQWNTSAVNDYANSAIHTWLNGDFFNSLGTVEQATIKQVKIPYRAGSGYSKTVTSGANGLPTKAFLVGGYELGITTAVNAGFPEDGARLAYFEDGATTTALAKRIANYNGAATYWWLRSAYCSSVGGSEVVWQINNSGSNTGISCHIGSAIRPALVLPYSARFDVSTLILKGVA